MATSVAQAPAQFHTFHGICGFHQEPLPYGSNCCWKCVEHEKLQVSVYWESRKYERLAVDVEW